MAVFKISHRMALGAITKVWLDQSQDWRTRSAQKLTGTMKRHMYTHELVNLEVIQNQLIDSLFFDKSYY